MNSYCAQITNFNDIWISRRLWLGERTKIQNTFPWCTANRWCLHLVSTYNRQCEIDKRNKNDVFWISISLKWKELFLCENMRRSHHVVQTFQMQLNTPRYNQIREHSNGIYLEKMIIVAYCVVKELNFEIDIHMSVNMTNTIPADCIT